MTVDTLSPDTRASLERIGSADVVIAVTSCATAEEVHASAATIREALGRNRPPLRVVLAHPDGVASGEPNGGSGTSSEPLELLACRLPPAHRVPFTMPDAHDSLHALFAIGDHAQARACGLFGSQPGAITADAVRAFIQPVLDERVDLVLPCYARHRFDGLIEKGIVYPLMRALYGRQARCQLGVDFSFSSRLTTRLVAPESTARSSPLWFLTEAVCGGMEVGQAHLSSRLPPADDRSDLSSALVLVLGPLFLEMERSAAFWQKIRGSRPVPHFGSSFPQIDESRAVDVRTMVESFQLGCFNLREIWGLVLPPASLLALQGLARLTPEQFRLPDDLWVRILFDFALGHRLRVINRDHLLRAITPIYLAWVASFALEVMNQGPADVQDRLERLGAAAEAAKPYFIARWRWPDRFNP